VLVLGVLGLVLGGAAAWVWLGPGAWALRRRVPVPAGLDEVDVQVRAYLEEHVDRVRAAPGDPDRHATLGLVYAGNGFWPEALGCFDNVARLRPDDPLAHLYRAVATRELGDLEGAVAALDELTRRFDSFPQGFAHLGDALLQAGRPEEAEEPFLRLIELAPGEWRGYAGLAAVRLAEQRHEPAAELLERAVGLAPDARIAHHRLGQAYRGLGRLDDARRELALGQDARKHPMPDAWSAQVPDHQKVLKDQFSLARQWRARGRPERGVEILEEALEWHPDHLDVMSNLGLAYYHANRAADARRLLEQVIEREPRRYRDHVNIAACHLRLGDHEAALAASMRAITMAPELAETYRARASILVALGRDDEAVAALESALERDRRNADTYVRLAASLARVGRTAEARDRLAEAIERDPGHFDAHVHLGDLSLDLGDVEAARSALHAARAFGRRDPRLAELERRLAAGGDA
jgi:tetratricopeptide (TPR) repeat protein